MDVRGQRIQVPRRRQHTGARGCLKLAESAVVGLDEWHSAGHRLKRVNTFRIGVIPGSRKNIDLLQEGDLALTVHCAAIIEVPA